MLFCSLLSFLPACKAVLLVKVPNSSGYRNVGRVILRFG